MFGVGVLADAVAEVEDVRRAGGGRIGVRCAESVEYFARLTGDRSRGTEQRIRIQIAL